MHQGGLRRTRPRGKIVASVILGGKQFKKAKERAARWVRRESGAAPAQAAAAADVRRGGAGWRDNGWCRRWQAG